MKSEKYIRATIDLYEENLKTAIRKKDIARYEAYIAAFEFVLVD